jgi:hypothetical protein
LDPKSDPNFFTFQVDAFWKWAANMTNIISRVLALQPLLLNLDETSVARMSRKSSRLVVNKDSPLLEIGSLQPFRYREHGKKHGAMTHVAMITDYEEVQQALPQIFLCSSKLVSAVTATRATSGKTQIWRGGSGWNIIANLMRVIEAIGEAIQPWQKSRQAIIFLDSATCHLSPVVLDAAHHTGILVIQIPALFTWLLQPYDTHVFSSYRSCLEQEYRRLLRVAEGHDITSDDWLYNIVRVASKFLYERSWLSAFEQNGLIGKQDHLSQALSAFNKPDCCPPNSAALEMLFPRRRTLHINSYFKSIQTMATLRRSMGMRVGVAKNAIFTRKRSPDSFYFRHDG